MYIVVLIIVGLFLSACDNEDSGPGKVNLDSETGSSTETGSDSEVEDTDSASVLETESVPSETDADTGSDTSTDSSTDTESETDSQSDTGEDTDSAGPVVSLISPEAPDEGDFSSEAILSRDRITAVCRAVASSASTSVDRSSVRIFAKRNGQQIEVVASPSTTEDQYTANLYLGDFPAGAVTIGCSASDLSDPPQKNTQSIVTYIDKGPQIEVLSPEENSFHGGEFELIFRVRASPLAPDDPGSQPDLESVSAVIGAADITSMLENDPSGSGVFRAVINFNDPVFDPPIDGDNTIIIRAANKRTTIPTVNEVHVSFTADSKGPVIEMTDPAAGELVGGIFTITATVTDSAGVDPQSVVATIAGLHEVALLNVSNSRFSASFDSRILSDTLVFPTIVLRAQDVLGNQSSFGRIVSLDNEPPVMSLDPPDVREFRYNSKLGRTECSWRFDPLGGTDPAGVDPDFGDSADDGQSVPQLVEIRARIEDLGNSAPSYSGVEIPRAGVDPSTVQLFILDDESGALLVDTNDDGYCDDINPLLIPSSVPSTADEAVVINLGRLDPVGGADYRPLPDPSTLAQPAFDTAAGATESICWGGVAEDPPKPLCGTSPGTRVIEGIYTIMPSSASQCFGNPFDSLAAGIADGWACLAVRGVDAVGNVGVSAPIRLCFNSDGTAADCDPWGTIETVGLPDCTGTYDPEFLTVDAGVDCALREAELPVPPARPRSWLFEDYPALQLVPQ